MQPLFFCYKLYDLQNDIPNFFRTFTRFEDFWEGISAGAVLPAMPRLWEINTTLQGFATHSLRTTGLEECFLLAESTWCYHEKAKVKKSNFISFDAKRN